MVQVDKFRRTAKFKGPVTMDDDLAVTGDLTVTGSLTAGATVVRTSDVVAAAGSNQGNAAALTADVNAVTGADGTKGVGLASVADGSLVWVTNTDATNTLKVYPASGDAINGLSADAAISIGPGQTVLFQGTSTSQWYAAMAATSSGTALANSPLVPDANKDVTGLRNITATGAIQGNMVTVAASADGAIAVANKFVPITKAGVCAMTLVDPTATTHDGLRMDFVATTANAHTLSNAAGSGFWSSGGASKDIATFGGAIGDRISIIAYQGKWYILDSLNITLG